MFLLKLLQGMATSRRLLKGSRVPTPPRPPEATATDSRALLVARGPGGPALGGPALGALGGPAAPAMEGGVKVHTTFLNNVDHTCFL